MRFKCIAVGIVVLAVVGLWQVRPGQGSGANKEGSQDTTDLLRHGEYLVSSASMCVDCHTPRDDSGRPDGGRMLRGATLPIRPKKETPDWADKSPDITGKGLAGKWSEEEMVKFLTTGIDPDGMKAEPPMPAYRLDARDARAVLSYLKSLPGSEPGKKGERDKGSK